MSRFDQHPDKPYASCGDCEETFTDRAQMSAHLSTTRIASKAGTSHKAWIQNQTRIERIENELEQLAEDALDDFVNNASELTDEGVTEEEITEAMRGVVADFEDAWKSRDD